MHGKPLSALLQILRSAGVTRYQTPELTLELGPPPPPKHAWRDLDQVIATEAHGEDEPDEEEGDPRFLLERLGPKHFPHRADPKRNAQ
jgi:hypothetical protein